MDEFFIQSHCEVISHSEPIGGEAFVVNIVSPHYLSKMIGDSAELGRGMIIINDFDKEKVKKVLQGLVDRSKASSWEELFAAIGRYFDWV